MSIAEAATELAAASPHGRERVASGTAIDHYVVRELLGSGGMGAVYRAEDTKLGRDVALKLLRDANPDTETCGILCSLLLREARTMARLAHPNLISVFDTGRHGSCVYVVMELISGETLRSWCTTPRSVRDRLDVLLQAGEGIVAAHGAQIYHRDIKPENVLVAGDRVRITDFGIARSAADLAATPDASCGCGSDDAAVSAAIEIAGTPAYMSPQQLRGEAADARSDQFSFAVMAWEVLYGALPFAATTPAERLSAIMREEIVVPPTTETSPRFAEVLGRALRPRAEVRYPSMRALVNALRDA